mgnify:FL=1|tara:strand:- start:2109 stop:2915 length:807 start_codon:yes stop_codon:yes gene_type:complete
MSSSYVGTYPSPSSGGGGGVELKSVTQSVANNATFNVVSLGVTSVSFLIPAGTPIADGSANTSTTDATPDMTGDTSPSGDILQSSRHSASVAGAPFNDQFVGALGWASNGGVAQWIGYDFSANGGAGTTCINKFAITTRFSSPSTYLGPKNFALHASNSSSFSSYDTLGTWTNIVWDAEGKKYFSVTNGTTYTCYRLYITLNNAGTNCQVSQLELIEALETASDAYVIQSPDPDATYLKVTPEGAGSKTVVITNKSGVTKTLKIEYVE